MHGQPSIKIHCSRLLCSFAYFQAQSKVCLTACNMLVTCAAHLYCDVKRATGGLLIHLQPTFNKTYSFQFYHLTLTL